MANKNGLAAKNRHKKKFTKLNVVIMKDNINDKTNNPNYFKFSKLGVHRKTLHNWLEKREKLCLPITKIPILIRD